MGINFFFNLYGRVWIEFRFHEFSGLYFREDWGNRRGELVGVCAIWWERSVVYRQE